MDATVETLVAKQLNDAVYAVALTREQWNALLNVESGRPCPACKRKVPMTGAQRQAAYRGRKS